MLADIFKNFRDKCNEIYERDPAHFVSAPELTLQACLRKTGVRLELLTYSDVLLMVEEWIRDEICQTISRCAKANNKYMNGCDKRKSSIISHVFRCKQFVWVGNISKTFCRWF